MRPGGQGEQGEQEDRGKKRVAHSGDCSFVFISSRRYGQSPATPAPENNAK
jgi:hypothetical protein